MPKFQTIQKVADDLGIGSSLIHTLIKDGEITKGVIDKTSWTVNLDDFWLAVEFCQGVDLKP